MRGVVTVTDYSNNLVDADREVVTLGRSDEMRSRTSHSHCTRHIAADS